MYVIPPFYPRFTLSRGRVRLGEFSELLALGRFLGYNAVRDVVYSERYAAPESGWPGGAVATGVANPLQVHTVEGALVSWSEVLRACRPLAPKKRIRDSRYFWNGEGPVPGTGRRGGYRFKRSPATTQELRMIAGVVPEEGEPVWRACRRELPTVWSDLILRPDHSWKQHRRTRWK